MDVFFKCWNRINWSNNGPIFRLGWIQADLYLSRLGIGSWMLMHHHVEDPWSHFGYRNQLTIFN